MSEAPKTPPPSDAPLADGRLPSSAMRSYALLTPDLKQLYMGFYKATYGKSKLDIKTKEFVAIAAALTTGCKGCLEGHLKKAKKEGATSDEIAEVMQCPVGTVKSRIFHGLASLRGMLTGQAEHEAGQIPPHAWEDLTHAV